VTEEELKLNSEGTPEKTARQSFWELARFALIAVAIVIPVRLFIAEPFRVSGSSMYPTFMNNDYLIVDKISYELGQPKRDDVVVFVFPDPNPKNPRKFFIKRIIGLPHETVDIKGSAITITNDQHVDGFKLDQPFVENEANNNMHFELKADEYFVMGDNRTASSDSRYWGPVKSDHLTGRAFLRLLPLRKISIWPGSFKQAE
jgi:signal peptidase I